MTDKRRILIVGKYCKRSNATMNIKISSRGLEEVVDISVCCNYAIPDGEYVLCKKNGLECPVFPTLLEKITENEDYLSAQR